MRLPDVRRCSFLYESGVLFVIRAIGSLLMDCVWQDDCKNPQ